MGSLMLDKQIKNIYMSSYMSNLLYMWNIFLQKMIYRGHEKFLDGTL